MNTTLVKCLLYRNGSPQMAEEKKVAVVTGSNKGIGFAIVRRLAKEKPNMTVILTARNAHLGHKALEQLQSEGLSNVVFHQLDILDSDSATALKEHLENNYGGLDVLIHNAGMAFKGSQFNEHVAKTTIGTNYFGTAKTHEILAPILREDARVVFVSSQAGKLGRLSQDLQAKFLKEDLTVSELDDLMNDFTGRVADDSYSQAGWPSQTYAVSKMGVSMLTRILARDSNVVINACCPGWVRTDMAGPAAPLSPDQGSITPVWLATLETRETGGFYHKKKLMSWV